MQYFESVKRAKIVLYTTGIICLFLSVLGFFVIFFAEPGSILGGISLSFADENKSIIDDAFVCLLILFVSIINIIGGLLYTRLYNWVWSLTYWANVIGLILTVVFFIIWTWEFFITYDVLWCILGPFGLCCLLVYLFIHDLKIKAFFRKWKG